MTVASPGNIFSLRHVSDIDLAYIGDAALAGSIIDEALAHLLYQLKPTKGEFTLPASNGTLKATRKAYKEVIGVDHPLHKNIEQVLNEAERLLGVRNSIVHANIQFLDDAYSKEQGVTYAHHSQGRTSAQLAEDSISLCKASMLVCKSAYNCMQFLRIYGNAASGDCFFHKRIIRFTPHEKDSES